LLEAENELTRRSDEVARLGLSYPDDVDISNGD
jgi:hypothetical protein